MIEYGGATRSVPPMCPSRPVARHSRLRHAYSSPKLSARVQVSVRSMWLGHVVPGSFRRGPRPAAPVGPAAGGAVQRCAEQLLPDSAPWPAVPHRGLRSRRLRAERTRVGPWLSRTSQARTPRRGRRHEADGPAVAAARCPSSNSSVPALIMVVPAVPSLRCVQQVALSSM